MDTTTRELTSKGVAARDAIMAAAAELFATHGVDRTSVGDIAAAAGVNRAMISYYFGSKGGLYDAIIDATVEEAAAALGDLQSRSPRQLVTALAGVLVRRPHFPRMIIYEYFRPGRLFEPGTAEKLSGFVKLTQAVLREAPLRPEARGYDPQIVHLIMVGALNYFLLTDPFRERMQGRLEGPLTRPSVEEFAETLGEILERGLLKPPRKPD